MSLRFKRPRQAGHSALSVNVVVIEGLAMGFPSTEAHGAVHEASGYVGGVSGLDDRVRFGDVHLAAAFKGRVRVAIGLGCCLCSGAAAKAMTIIKNRQHSRMTVTTIRMLVILSSFPKARILGFGLVRMVSKPFRKPGGFRKFWVAFKGGSPER